MDAGLVPESLDRIRRWVIWCGVLAKGVCMARILRKRYPGGFASLLLDTIQRGVCDKLLINQHIDRYM